MASIARELTLEIARTLLRLTPGGAFVADRFSGTLKAVLESAAQRGANVDLIKKIAENIAEAVRSRTAQEGGNMGAAESAALGVLETVRAAKLTPDLLVSLRLDPKRLAEHLVQTFPPVDLRMASVARRRLYGQGVEEFCEGLMGSALALPGVQLAIQQDLLRGQAAILERLERLR